MLRVVTCDEMRAMDSETINTIGVPSLVLMENAATAIVRVLEDEYPSLPDRRVHVLAGSGNNGGDGFAAARHLLNKGCRVRVYFVGNHLSDECRHNYEVFERLGGEIYRLDTQSLPKLRFSLSLGGIVIDALLGTGFRGSLTGLAADVVETVNASGLPVTAVDVPSGCSADTGAVGGPAIRAVQTVVLGCLKQGLLLYPAAEYVGIRKVVDIGIPRSLEPPSHRFLLTADTVSLPYRVPCGHKGTFGHALVIAGSRQYAGAAALASRACLRSGAGMVTLAVPESIVGRFSPSEVITVPVPDTTLGALGSVSQDTLADLLPGKDALILGCGLGGDQETAACVRSLLQSWSGPLVLDADGINALQNQLDTLESVAPDIRRQWVLTPHPGELGRLVGQPAEDVDRQRVEAAHAFSEAHGVNVVLKGAPTIVAGRQRLFFNTSGNHGMASAGTGDVLSGIIGGLLCQGASGLDAAAAGVFFHGTAGDTAAARGSRRGLTAGDIIQVLPEVLDSEAQ